MVMTEQSDDNLVACWSCRGPVAAAALFCHTCGAVQPPGGRIISRGWACRRRFDLDAGELDRRYFAFQRNCIPTASSPSRPRSAPWPQSQAASLNEAYRDAEGSAAPRRLSARARGTAECRGERQDDRRSGAADGGHGECARRLMEAEDAAAVDALGSRARRRRRCAASPIWPALSLADDLNAADRQTHAPALLDKLAEEARAQARAIWRRRRCDSAGDPRAGRDARCRMPARELAVGIDLGTTNSVVAIARDGKARGAARRDGEALVPSVVAYPRRWRRDGRRGRACRADRRARRTSSPRSSA